MAKISRSTAILLASTACAALAGCGPSDIASPGSGGNITINNPAPTPTPPAPTPTPTVVAASACPTIAATTQLTDSGTLTGPTGSWRVCTLPRVIDRSVQLPKVTGLVYQMNGRVDVGCDGGFKAPTAAAPFATSTIGCPTANLVADTNVTLTIDPGVILVGAPGASWLAVNRGNKISAVGTATAPIIFTSRDNVTGQASDSSLAQWGGVVLMGRGVITDCDFGSTVANTCERKTEGAADPALFGGTDNAYNAGTMKFVQIRFSGYVIGADKELQALTTEGTGTGTTLEFIQSHNSSDDGAEFFGGAVNFKHYIATGADDDSLDVDTGLQGNFQYVLLVQRTGQGDAFMEVDSNGFEDNAPRQKTNVVNFTAIQSQVSSNNEANDGASILVRGNSDLTLANGVVLSPNNECLRMNGSSTSGSAVTTLVAKSVAMTCNATKYLGTGSLTAAQVQTIFGSGANGNNDTFTSTLTSLFINGTGETAVAAFDAKTLNAFFDTTTYIGAVRNSTDTWYASWTCNSGFANFGTGSGSCNSLPTT